MNMYEYLEQEFRERGYTWNIDGEPVVPIASDIQKVVDRAAESLYSQHDGSLVEVGRLIIQKAPGKVFDIYLHVGEVK